MTETYLAAGPATPLTLPTPDELLTRASKLRELLAEESTGHDAHRRLSDRTVAAIGDAGLFRMYTPREFGGYEAVPSTSLAVICELARGCSSTAWVTSVLNLGNYVAALFPQRARNEVWAENPDARTALMIGDAPAQVERVAGGVIVNGKWPFASGSLHCDWVIARIPSGSEPESLGPHLVLMPRERLEVEDTWHVVGLRGTGSNTVVARELFIPAHRIVSLTAVMSGTIALPDDAGDLYRSSYWGVLSTGLIGALIGGVHRAYDYVLEKAPVRKVTSSNFASQADSPAFHIDLAEASMMLDTAYLHARHIASTVDQAARSGESPDPVRNARIRMHAAHVAQTCREAIDVLVTAHGTASFAEVNPLQLVWRDIHVGSRHAGFGMGMPQMVHGRALVGKNPADISAR
ncbi:acyl-CoA dehydrogenase [Nocardia sp. ET3-3]|uniref:Acyl-CoA dehydrogenase n=1 Tax=Nocardia terrae TaxID=2675851 RepID=A0A7K1V3Y1_9NOCA|nr:acyl-CoA dehydrogenase family protein [Nocardia terrae]MVU81316.1 acyl-CoA dehydrogenase [Nocardia terrae]